MADDFINPSALSENRTQNFVGVLGATSSVGSCLLPILTAAEWNVIAFSRKAIESNDPKVEWRQLAASVQRDHPAEAFTFPLKEQENIGFWICLGPIWILPDYLALLETREVKRIVALSSTSRFTKDDSTDPEEQAITHRLAESETRVRDWAENRGVEWVILRPTLIYGLNRDKNITEVARFISRFGFFPLFGKANGLRQPIHVEDVAGACLAALQKACAANRAYNISGGEILSYREMITRVFTALGRRACLPTVPLWFFRQAVAVLRHLPRYRKWTAAMAERMNRNMTFDHAEAARDLDFTPRKFILSKQDINT